MIEIKTESLYADAIYSFVKRINTKNHNNSLKDKVELIAAMIIGTKDYRYGPMPPLENQVNIRAIIRNCINLNIPIPILVPFGGRKLNESDYIDVAELSAIKQLIFLHDAVKEVYPVGVHISIRVEDINAIYLYGKQSTRDSMYYSNSFTTLVNIFCIDKNIVTYQESEYVSIEKYETVASTYEELLFSTIYQLENDTVLEDIEDFKQLNQLGWKGTIPKEQREYYIGRYRNLYNMNDEDAYRALARYFAGSKARYDLNIRGSEHFHHNKFIQLNFAHPVPNAPIGIFDTTVYWRTIPAFEGRTHIAAWRAKGYLIINEELQTTTVKISSYHDLPPLETCKLVISNEIESVVLNVPYIIE
jgi:hypothetical protein